jgi:folate-binding protein YgfZ
VAYTPPMTDASDADYEVLRHGAGLADRSAYGRLVLTGADRQRFLNGQVTCDVKALTPGSGAYGFFTSPQGKVLADASVLLHADEIWLELPPGREEAIAAQLRKYIIVDRVEVRPLAGYRVLTLLGPRAAEVLRTLASDLPESPWSHLTLPELGDGVTLVRQDGLGVSAWSLWTPEAAAAALSARLLDVPGVPGVRPVGPEALEVVRAEAGIPLYGKDFGAENFPQETGLEERAVSYTKGCYLGQEVVARIHFRGGVHKGLAGLVFPVGSAVPAVGTKLVCEEKEVGTLQTAVRSPALGRPIGLAILHQRALAPGTRVELVGVSEGGGEEGGGMAEVCPLPFVPAA